MSNYFNPATVDAIIAADGRELNHVLFHEEYISQLRPGECLAWRLSRRRLGRRSSVQVAEVTDRSEWDVFGGLYNRGRIGGLGFYAIPAASPGWSSHHPPVASCRGRVMIRPVVWLLSVVGLAVEAVLAVWDFLCWLRNPLRSPRIRQRRDQDR